jgi:hypothetical protein
MEQSTNTLTLPQQPWHTRQIGSSILLCDALGRTLAMILDHRVADTILAHLAVDLDEVESQRKDLEEADDQVEELQKSKRRRAMELRVVKDALDKLLIYAIEFYNDWCRGNFQLPKLAQCDMESMAAQFDKAKQALEKTK